MTEIIVSFVVGVVCILLGISNMKGNILSIHSYHRHRVSEQDRIPFGRKVGMGTLIIGVAAIVLGITTAITDYTDNNVYMIVGAVIFVVALIIGLGISFYAMIKYNKGIF